MPLLPPEDTMTADTTPRRKWRPNFAPKTKEAKVWDPEKMKRCSLYPRSPEEFALRQEQMAAHARQMAAEGKWGRKKSVPNGVVGARARERLFAGRDAARELSIKIVKYMKQNEIVTVDDHRAEQALEAAVEIAVGRDKEGNFVYAEASRIASIRMILDFTKRKPATKAEIKLEAAEDWLAALAGKAERADAKAPKE